MRDSYPVHTDKEDYQKGWFSLNRLHVSFILYFGAPYIIKGYLILSYYSFFLLKFFGSVGWCVLTHDDRLF